MQFGWQWNFSELERNFQLELEFFKDEYKIFPNQDYGHGGKWKWTLQSKSLWGIPTKNQFQRK